MFEIIIIEQEGEFLTITDSKKKFNSRIHESLISANEIEVIDGKFYASETLYSQWFKDDLRKEALEKEKENVKNNANKFFVQFDYPLNEKGHGVSAEFFSENEETAREEALAVYQEQFKENATGKIIKFVRYRKPWEVHEFCKEKYGSPVPRKIECGYLIWAHAPVWEMPYSPMGMRSIPYLEDWENGEYNVKIEAEIEKHWDVYRQLPRRIKKMFFKSNTQFRNYLKIFPECEEHVDFVKKWNEDYDTLRNKIRHEKTKNLTLDQLELLGINYNVYDRKYQGGKAYIIFNNGDRMEVAPEFGKVSKE